MINMAKKFKIKKWKIFVILTIIVVSSILQFCMNDLTVPMRNEITINQLNGGNAAMIENNTSRTFIANSYNYIWIISLIVSILIVQPEIKYVIKNRNKQTQK
jgi:hypothetical protein